MTFSGQFREIIASAVVGAFITAIGAGLTVWRDQARMQDTLNDIRTTLVAQVADHETRLRTMAAENHDQDLRIISVADAMEAIKAVIENAKHK